MSSSIAPGFASQLVADLDPEDVCTVLSVFRDDLDRLGAKLRRAAETSDGDGFHKVAHSMAGAAGAVGAAELEALCRFAMANARTDLEQLPPLAARIEQLCRAARVEMGQFIARTMRPSSAGA